MKIIKKGTFLGDSFEQLTDMAKDTAKNTGKGLVDTFAPNKIVENAFSNAPAPQGQEAQMQKQAESMKKGGSHTPLDLQNLESKYRSQDDLKAKALARSYFQNVKGGEKAVFEKKKQEEEQKKLREEQAKKDREQQIIQQQQQQQKSGTPQGKVRKNILGGGHKKAQVDNVAEMKPGKGKQ